MNLFFDMYRNRASLQLFNKHFIFRNIIDGDPDAESPAINAQLVAHIHSLSKNPKEADSVIRNHDPRLLHILDYYADARKANAILVTSILFYEEQGKVLPRHDAIAICNWFLNHEVPDISAEKQMLFNAVKKTFHTAFPRTLSDVPDLLLEKSKHAKVEIRKDDPLHAAIAEIHGRALEQFREHGDAMVEENRLGEIKKIQGVFPGIEDGKPITLNRENRMTLLLLGRIAKRSHLHLQQDDIHNIVLFCAGKLPLAQIDPRRQQIYREVASKLSLFYRSLETLPAEWPRNKDGAPRTSFVDRRRLSRLMAKGDDTSNPAPEDNERPTSMITNLQQVLDIVDRDPRIKVVSFDLMDTLVEWTEKPGNRSVLMDQRMADIINKKFGLSLSKRVTHEFYAKHHSINRKKGWGERKDFKVRDLFKGMIEEIIQENHLTVNPKDAASVADDLENVTYTTQIESMIETPRAKHVLAALKRKGIKIAVYSNTTFSKTFVEKSLEKVGLLSYIDTIFASSETGDLKSESSNNAYAHIRKWQPHYRVDQFLHIGDQEKADYLGPTNYGMQARFYKNPLALKELREHSTGTAGYAKLQYDNLTSRVDADAKDYMERNIPAKDLTPAVREAAQQAYDITRNTYGPAVLHFCKGVIEQLLKDPKRMILCWGRDSFSMFVILKRLIATTPGLSDKIDHKRVQMASVSRKLMQKAGNDANIDYAYPKKKKLPPSEYQGYAKKLDTYLQQLGFHDYEHVTILDSGNTGTGQTILQTIYPKKNIEGQYLYLKRESVDPAAHQKTGYLLQKDTNSTQVHGNKIFLDPESVHFFEDFFNGIFRSNTELATKNGRVSPYEADGKISPSRKLTPVEGAIVDPDTLRKDFQKFSVYHLMKKMVIKGLLDRARLDGIEHQLDPTGKHHLALTEAEAKAKLGTFVEDFVAKRKDALATPHDNLFSLLIRQGRENNVSPAWIKAWKQIGVDEGYDV